MSIKSTYNIDRETAIEVINNKINSCSNEELSEILECFKESYFRNYWVFDNLPDGDTVIRSVDEF